jgi:signal transduction histidine kinase
MKEIFDRLRRNRLWPLYAVTGYVILQFSWWAYMIVSLHGQIYDLSLAELMEGPLPDPEKLLAKAEMDRQLSLKVWMVLGEGSVFIGLMLLGFRAVRRAVQSELQLGQQQRNFLHSVTHELKSPIAAIRLHIQTLAKRTLDEEKKQQLYASALTEADRLQRLIDNVLLAARLEAGRLPMHPILIDVASELRTILLRAYERELASGRIVLTANDGIMVNCDPEAFNSIINNLLTNALKYSPNDTAVQLLVERQMNEVVISVIDKGQGISDNEKALVLTKFYRSGQEDTRRSKGTGLGLFITSELANANRATFRLKDNLPTGTIAEVFFPLD